MLELTKPLCNRGDLAYELRCGTSRRDSCAGPVTARTEILRGHYDCRGRHSRPIAVGL